MDLLTLMFQFLSVISKRAVDMDICHRIIISTQSVSHCESKMISKTSDLSYSITLIADTAV